MAFEADILFVFFSSRTYHEVDYLNLAVKVFNVWHYIKNVKYLFFDINQAVM